jgi:collagenase-like PrtC family protease
LPFLIEFIKKEFPEVEIVVSTIAHIKSVQGVKFYENLGAHRLLLSYMINRNFKLLKNIVSATTCEIEILVNESCLFHCPIRNYHYNLVSHASQQEMKIIQYPFLKCTVIKLKDPAELIKARWIRPEDIQKYESLGVNLFKLAGREKPTEWILKCAESYFQRRYKGNLLDIIAIVLLPTYKFGLEVSKTTFPPTIYLDNQKLDGFITFFEKSGDKCDGGCNTCSYCDNVSKKAIFYNKKEAELYIKELELLSSNFLGSFKSKTKENNYEKNLFYKDFERKIS